MDIITSRLAGRRRQGFATREQSEVYWIKLYITNTKQNKPNDKIINTPLSPLVPSKYLENCIDDFPTDRRALRTISHHVPTHRPGKKKEKGKKTHCSKNGRVPKLLPKLLPVLAQQRFLGRLLLLLVLKHARAVCHIGHGVPARAVSSISPRRQRREWGLLLLRRKDLGLADIARREEAGVFAADDTTLPPVVFDLFEDLELVAGKEREVAGLGAGESPQGIGEGEHRGRSVGRGRDGGDGGDGEEALGGVGTGWRGEGGV